MRFVHVLNKLHFFVGQPLNFSVFKAHEDRTQVFIGGFSEGKYHYYQETFDTDLMISLSKKLYSYMYMILQV